MNDQEILDFVQGMEEHFGELPNPEHEPRRFEYCIRMYKYYLSRTDERATTTDN
jgi:hypothetical protein